MAQRCAISVGISQVDTPRLGIPVYIYTPYTPTPTTPTPTTPTPRTPPPTACVQQHACNSMHAFFDTRFSYKSMFALKLKSAS